MTIDEAIKRYTSNAKYERQHGNLQGYLEFNQLAEWLKELKELKAKPKGKWIDNPEYCFVECPFCHSATNCEGSIKGLNYCFSCGARLEE